MATNDVLPTAAEQPAVGGLDVLTMSGAEIKHQISATHVPPEKDFDANSLFVVVEKIIEQILWGEEDPDSLEEGATTDSLDLTLSTDEQLSLEMAHKASDVQTTHRTTMSILNKLSSYSWQSKAVLALANFALNYKKYVLATTRGDPSAELIESVDIPAYLTTFYHEEEIEKMIFLMLATTDFFLEQNSTSWNDAEVAMDGFPVLVYWIIMSVVACTTPMFCLTSNEDNTQELLSLAESIYYKLNEQKMRVMCPEKLKAMRRVKEFLQTRDEVTEVLMALIFGRDDVQPLIDSCVDVPVSLDVLKDKGVLLFFSDLQVSRDDILIMKPVYEKITYYNIVWIPIVAQWTDELRKKFDMLRSQMPWYVLQYFSELAGIKFIKEEWHVENGPVVVAMDARGNIQRENVLPLIREEGAKAFPIGGPRLSALVMPPPGPHAMEDYTFHCGGKDSRWIKEFSDKVNAIAEDPIIRKLIYVECSCVENVNTWNPFKKAPKTRKMNEENEEIQRILPSFKNEKRWAVLMKWSTKTVSDDGPTILKFLEMFDEWKHDVSEKGFENCFREYSEKPRSTNPNPSTSLPV